MNLLKQFLFVGFISSNIVSIALAGEVTSNFVAGDTLDAASLTEMKDAVNDNNTRTGALQHLLRAVKASVASV